MPEAFTTQKTLWSSRETHILYIRERTQESLSCHEYVGMVTGTVITATFCYDGEEKRMLTPRGNTMRHAVAVFT